MGSAQPSAQPGMVLTVELACASRPLRSPAAHANVGQVSADDPLSAPARLVLDLC
jgi:hypothetical protein